MSADLEALEALLAIATPVPWSAFFTVHGDPYITPDEHADTSPLAYQIAKVSVAPEDYGRANCELIAAAVNSLPQLIAEIRGLREENQSVSAELHDTKQLLSALTVAVDRFMQTDADEAVELTLWQAMGRAVSAAGEVVYPLEGEPQPLTDAQRERFEAAADRALARRRAFLAGLDTEGSAS